MKYVYINFLEFPGGLTVYNSALSLLWCRFDPWLGNFFMPQAWPKKNVHDVT